MRFAFIDEQRVEAAPGLSGVCPICTQPVIAKSGAQTMHHWSHLSTSTCDSWWEQETAWHRAWKSNFSGEWQEVISSDQKTGEIHVADVRTDHGLVIKFQHSPIKAGERSARENFHGDMVWVVDGMRLKGGYQRFLNSKEFFQPVMRKGLFCVYNPKECFPPAWLTSAKAVIFDFSNESEALKEKRSNLYCLFPTRIGAAAFVAEISRHPFVGIVNSGGWPSWVSRTTVELINYIRALKVMEARRKQQQLVSIMFGKTTRQKKRRF